MGEGASFISPEYVKKIILKNWLAKTAKTFDNFFFGGGGGVV